jgi:hypothetical protein
MQPIRTIRKFVSSALGRKTQQMPSFSYSPGDVVIEDFAEFSGLPLETVVGRIRDFRTLNAEDWKAFKGERVANFYESSTNYAFDVLSANPRPDAVRRKLDRFNPHILESIRKHPGARFFEFGGGLGVMCEIVARMGKNVTYMDLPGIVFDFAQWRFQKLGLNVTAIEAKGDTIFVPGTYDIVYTDAVIEHLPPPQQVEATNAIAGGVAGGGLLIFLVDPSGPTVNAPTHFNVNVKDLHRHLSVRGLKCEEGYRTFCSIWRRA